MAHIDRWDALTQLVGRVICAVLWFHPLAWMVLAILRREQERACDDRVLAAGESATAYARHLLSLITRESKPLAPWAAMHASGGRQSAASRIRAILDLDLRRDPLGRRMRAAMIGGSVAFAAGLFFGSDLGAETTVASTLDAKSALRVVEPVAAEMRELEIPGAVVVLVKDGEVILSRGFGEVESASGRRVDAERTVFRIGSITKVITAIALLQALDEHGIDLDHPVADLAPGLEVPSAGGKPVTPRHLLTHTGGFDQLGYRRHARTAYEVLPLGMFLRDQLVAQRPPGSVSTYDTYGITLAGHLVERLSGATYTDYVTENVFRRLGMKRSGFQVRGATGDELAVGYAGYGDEMKPQAWEFHHTTPASSANSTGSDMARLMIALLDDCELDGERLLESATCAELTSQQFSNHPELAGYGFGFLTDRRGSLRIAEHGGSMDGFSALLYLLPDEKLGLFVAASREDARFAEGLKAQILRTFYPAALEVSVEPPLAETGNPSRFAGQWISTMRCHTCDGRQDHYWRADPFELAVGDRGYLEIGGGAVKPIGRHLLQRDDGLRVAFREDATGRVSHLFIRQSVYERFEGAEPPPPNEGDRWVHPPCPVDCGERHDRVTDEPSVCPICRMRYVAERG